VDNFILVRDAQLMNLFVLDMMVELDMPLSEILTLAEVKAGGAYVFAVMTRIYPMTATRRLKKK